MKTLRLPPIFSMILSIIISSISGQCLAQTTAPEFLVEAYPDTVLASKQGYHRQVVSAGSGVTNVPFYLIVPTLQRWTPGNTVRVAFNGGEKNLYEKIIMAASAWQKKAGINLVFSFTDPTGNYRSWSATDTVYSAEIRIAFDSGAMGGYWSHVGTDSVNQSIVGGAPNQASMNLDSFDKSLPGDWETTVIHEFGHALGFEHEHQNQSGGCDFRFDDDPGYVATKDAQGWYALDANGNRPGLYTYLGGYANNWPRDKVDRNLRDLPTSSAFLLGVFDKKSIMKYVFNAFMFKAGKQSPCYTESENLTVSAQDSVGAQLAYPKGSSAVAGLRNQKRTMLEQLRSSPLTGSELRIHLTSQLKNF